MTVSSFPVWIIVLVSGLVVLIALASCNYYLTPMSKLRARCLRDKPMQQRNNSIIRVKRRIDESCFEWMAFGLYVVSSICFIFENRQIFSGISVGYLIMKIMLGILLWFVMAIITTVFISGLMAICQENAIADLKKYYQNNYRVTLIYLDKIDEEYYYDYELSD